MVSKLLKKLPILFILISLSVLTNLVMQNSAEAACAKTATGAIITQDISGASDTTPFALTTSPTTFDQDQCSEEPLFYKITFYEVKLCTADPYTGFTDDDESNTSAPDFKTCVPVFSGEKEIVIEPGKKVNLLEGDLILPLGTYKYSVVILSNHLQIKHYQRFANASDADVSIRGYKASGNQAGTVCYTGNKGVNQFMTTYNNEIQTGGVIALHNVTLPSVTAGSSAGAKILCNTLSNATAGNTYAMEIIDHLGEGAYLTDNTDFRNHTAYEDSSITGVRMAGNMLQSDGVTLGTTIENSVRLAGYFDFATPVVIDEDVIGLNLDFNTSSSVSIDFSVDDSNDLIYGDKVGADPFVLRFIATKAQ